MALNAGKVNSAGVGKTFKYLATAYLEQDSTDRCPGGKDQTAQHGQDVSWWQDRIGSMLLAHIDESIIEQALDTYAATPCTRYNVSTRDRHVVEGRYPAPSSRNRKLACIRRIYAFGAKRKMIGKNNPANDVWMLREDNARKRFLSPEEIQRLLLACRNSNYDRLYVFVLGLLQTGARKNEWLQMDWSCIDMAKRQAVVPTTKNGQPIVLTLPPDLVAELRRIQGDVPQISGLLFPGTRNPSKPYSIRKSWEAAVKAAGLQRPMEHAEYFRMHDLRHCTASLLAANGATLVETGAVLNHKSPQSTNRYAHLCVNVK